MSEPTLLEDFTWRGQFWRPDRPAVQVAGTVVFTANEGLVLDLDGLVEDVHKSFSGTSQFPLLLGTVDAGPVTLLDALQRSFHFGGVARSSYRCRFLLVGHHFDSREHVEARHMSLSFTGLEEWLGHAPFSWRAKPDRWPPQISYRHRPPAEVAFAVPEVDATITFGSRLNVESTRTTLGQESIALITIAPPARWSLEQFLERTMQLQALLRALMGHNVFVLRAEALVTERTRSAPPSGIAVYFGDRSRNSAPREAHAHEMPFTARALGRRMKSVLSRWFAAYDELGPVLNVFFGALYAPFTYSESEFLSLSQAVESFHRRRFGGLFVSKTTYDKVYASLVNAIPRRLNADLAAALKGRLRYGNEVSLRSRIRDSLKKIGSEGGALVANDAGVFVRRVTDTRNYLTHYDPSLKSRAATGVDLYWLTRRLERLMMLLLFRDMGIPTKRAAAALKAAQTGVRFPDLN